MLWLNAQVYDTSWSSHVTAENKWVWLKFYDKLLRFLQKYDNSQVKTEGGTRGIHSCVSQKRGLQKCWKKWLNMYINMGKYILHLQTFHTTQDPSNK